MQTLIYARYSSQLQNPRSVADQLADCRTRARAEGWQVVGEFHDSEISGAAGLAETQRPGIAALLARLESGGIDQVLTEHTDRIARHQGDAYAVRERIEHAGARLFTLMQGVVDEITGTIQGLFDAKQRKDLGHRVRRGHKGNITQGRAASGVAYGYRKVAKLDDRGEPIRGQREIDEEKAAIVLRVFEEYAGGRSPRQIAGDLNAEGIPAPRGGIWRSSTIVGHRGSGFGVLANPIYIGQLIYGRSKSVTDPRTRRRAMRRGDGEITSGDAPHLRIVDDALWQAVQDQIECRTSLGFNNRPERQRRPRHLLSGLGKCGVCGGSWIVTRDSYFGCSSVIDGNACTNRRLINKDEYERRVLAEMEEQMLAPDVVEAYMDEYRREHTRLTRELGRERQTLERRKADAARKVDRLVTAIAEGGGEFAEIRAALAKAKGDQAAAEKALASAEALPRIALHPGLARQYRAAIADLGKELADETTRREAAPRLRKLIARIVVTPTAGQRGVRLEVVRHIDEIMNLAAAPVRRTA
jgi:DNA invertase Pin-like site-specific DNA recombinase